MRSHTASKIELAGLRDYGFEIGEVVAPPIQAPTKRRKYQVATEYEVIGR